MGGASSEREISLSTGRQVLASLDPERYDAFALDTAALFGQQVHLPPEARALSGDSSGSTAMVPLTLSDIAAPQTPHRPDVVFLALHGKGGEDGTIQGMLDLLGIPYTGSGVLASALAMDKAMAKRVLKTADIPVPGEILLHRAQAADAAGVDCALREAFGYPVIVKPNAQGSTIGCGRVDDVAALPAALAAAFAYDETVLVEEFVAGVEITVGVLGNANPEALPVVEIVSEEGFYDYHAKYAPGGSRHVIPARISDTAAAKAQQYAVTAHRTLGCRGMSRTDLIVRGDEPVVLEVNTIPGMTPTSLLPDAARAAGISFAALLDRLIGYALE